MRYLRILKPTVMAIRHAMPDGCYLLLLKLSNNLHLRQAGGTRTLYFRSAILSIFYRLWVFIINFPILLKNKSTYYQYIG